MLWSNPLPKIGKIKQQSVVTFLHYQHRYDSSPKGITVLIVHRIVLFLGTGLLLPRWRTGKPVRGRYLFYNHFISILIVIQYQQLDLRTLYAFCQSSLVSLSQKSHRYGYGGIISSPFVYILIF